MKYFPSTTVLALCLSVLAVPATAGTVQDGSDGNTTWQTGVDGVEVEWNADGSVKRISSRYNTPVESADRRGISKAQIIAEEKAKAAIVRFFDQSVASTKIVAEMQNDLHTATQERESGKTPVVKKFDNRTMVEAVTEVTASFASGRLRGVVVLEKGYSDKSEEAWVVVGISDRSIRAARDLQNMGREQQMQSVGREQQTAPANSAPDSLGRQPSEVRRSNQRNW
jgi:hypothetical protein